jgi:hypothetical protein
VGLTDHLEAALALHEHAQPLSKDGVIVDQDNSYLIRLS